MRALTDACGAGGRGAGEAGDGGADSEVWPPSRVGRARSRAPEELPGVTRWLLREQVGDAAGAGAVRLPVLDGGGS